MFKIAEVAHVPELPKQGTVSKRNARALALEVPLFIANEVVADKEYWFPDGSICGNVGRRAKRSDESVGMTWIAVVSLPVTMQWPMYWQR